MIEALIREESVLHLDDLLLRRMDGAPGASLRGSLAVRVARLLGWSDERARIELETL